MQAVDDVTLSTNSSRVPFRGCPNPFSMTREISYFFEKEFRGGADPQRETVMIEYLLGEQNGNN
jgi:hypothetical protein